MPCVLHRLSLWPIILNLCTMPSSFCRASQSIPMNSSGSEVLMIKKVAEYLQVTERTICRPAAAKKTPSFKISGMWRFRTADIDGGVAVWSKQVEDSD